MDEFDKLYKQKIAELAKEITKRKYAWKLEEKKIETIQRKHDSLLDGWRRYKGDRRRKDRGGKTDMPKVPETDAGTGNIPVQ